MEQKAPLSQRALVLLLESDWPKLLLLVVLCVVATKIFDKVVTKTDDMTSNYYSKTLSPPRAKPQPSSREGKSEVQEQLEVPATESKEHKQDEEATRETKEQEGSKTAKPNRGNAIDIPQLDPLEKIKHEWPHLPEDVRRSILRLVDSVDPEPKKDD